jgi:tight adherence protein B
MNTNFLMSLIPAFAVFMLLFGVYKTFLEKKVQAQEHIQDLMGTSGAKPLVAALLGKNQDNILKKRKKNKDGQLSKMDALEIKLERANLMITTNEFILISMGVSVVGGLLLWLSMGQNLLLAIPLGGACSLLPYVYLLLRIMLRMKKAAATFADVLDSMVNAFKTGFGFSRAVQMIADNFDDPWGTEFGKMAAEMNLGSSMEDALYGLAARVPSQDVDLFVTALLIQKETGGSMAELLGNLGKTIRDRYKLYQKVGAISAQGKLSAGIVCCVPLVLCAIMFVFLPDATLKFVTNPIGIGVLVIAGFWMCCGVGVLYKIVQIEV